LPFLIEAMWALEGVQLVIAGEGREAERLRRQARIVGLSERVHFTGRVDRASAVGLLRGAAVFCLPANQRSEAFGLCQIEAMTCGLPVVSTDLPTGVPEINRDGETGIIAPPGDAKGLTEALGRLLGDAALRRRMGEAGRRRAAEHYTAERMAREVVEVYREALARGGSTSAVSGVSTVD
jgi:rhamnosyl/mannosyltransferase